MRNSIRSWIGHVIRSLQESKTTVVNDANKYRLIQEIQGYQGIYDGKAHGVSIKTADNCRVEYSIDRQKWESENLSFLHVGSYRVFIKVSRNKWVENASATVIIKKRKIVLQSLSAEKKYDGLPIEDCEIIISGEGIVGEDLLEASATGNQLIVGTCKNNIKYQFKNAETEGDYSVEIVEGILEVLDRNDKYKLTLL